MRMEERKIVGICACALSMFQTNTDKIGIGLQF